MTNAYWRSLDERKQYHVSKDVQTILRQECGIHAMQADAERVAAKIHAHPDAVYYADADELAKTYHNLD